MLQWPELLQSEQTKDGDRRTRSSEEAEIWILWQYFIVWLLWSTDGHLVPHDTSPTITQIATIVHRAIVYRCNQQSETNILMIVIKIPAEMGYSEKLVTDDHLETPSCPPTWPASLPASEITSTISSSRLLLLKIENMFVVCGDEKNKI